MTDHERKQIPGLPTATEANDNDRLIKRDTDSGSDQQLEIATLLERVVNNGGGIDSLQTGTIAERPAAGSEGAWFLSTDEPRLYRDDGIEWVQVLEGVNIGTDSDEVPTNTQRLRQITIDGDSNHTLTDAEATADLIRLTGTLTVDRDLIVPDVARKYTIINDRAGSFDTTVKTAAGTGVIIPRGEVSRVYSDGTDVVRDSVLDNSDVGGQSGHNSPEGVEKLARLDRLYDSPVFVPQLFHVQDQKASDTAGGSSSSGTQTRDLNTVVTNEITGASLASNQVTLPAGKYYIEASAPTYRSGSHKLRPYNDTDSSYITELLGTSEFTSASIDIVTRSFSTGNLTLTESKAIEIRHSISNAKADNGLGVKANTGDPEVYTDLKIWRIG